MHVCTLAQTCIHENVNAHVPMKQAHMPTHMRM